MSPFRAVSRLEDRLFQHPIARRRLGLLPTMVMVFTVNGTLVLVLFLVDMLWGQGLASGLVVIAAANFVLAAFALTALVVRRPKR